VRKEGIGNTGFLEKVHWLPRVTGVKLHLLAGNVHGREWFDPGSVREGGEEGKQNVEKMLPL